MGVDFITCSKCQATFPDCGPNDYCVIGHRLCPRCMPDVPREWDVDEEDENRAEILARRTDDGELTCAECPVCQMGGTKEQRQEKELTDLRARLAAAEALITLTEKERDIFRAERDGCRGQNYVICSEREAAEKQRDTAEAALAVIDKHFCPMALSHSWVQAGLDAARATLAREGK